MDSWAHTHLLLTGHRDCACRREVQQAAELVAGERARGALQRSLDARG